MEFSEQLNAWSGAGVLGMVLAWLFLKHLPAKDKQLREFIRGRDEAFDAARRDFTAALEKLGEAHKAAVTEVSRHCREEVERFLSVVAGRGPARSPAARTP